MSGRELTPIEARVLPFRRPAAAVRVRRRSLWSALGRPFVQAMAVVGVPAAAVAWGLSSPSFALGAVEVSGNRFVESAWVERTLAPLAGENLFRLSLADVEQRLLAHPWVAQVTMRKRLPSRLRLEIVEREPAALLRTAQGLVYLDGDGRTIAPLEPARGPADLPLVSVGGRAAVDLAGALAIAEELAAVAPDWGAALSEIEVLGDGDFRLYLGALPFPLLVRRGTLRARVPLLRSLLPELVGRYVRLVFVDLRSDRRIVFQPVAERS